VAAAMASVSSVAGEATWTGTETWNDSFVEVGNGSGIGVSVSAIFHRDDGVVAVEFGSVYRGNTDVLKEDLRHISPGPL